MIIEPKVRGFICTAAHPKGCFKGVEEQMNYVEKAGKFKGPKNVLVIGASKGYGLASRIVATFGAGAKTIGVFYEKAASGKRTATAGWYNTAAFESFAKEAGYYAKSVNGDAFSNEIKEKTIKLIREDLGKIDLIIYSIASPRRIDPETGETYCSVLRTIGNSYTNRTVDPTTGEIKEVTVGSATEKEIHDTVKVMGGEDWKMWTELLQKEDLLAEGCINTAYSYIGPELTFPVYKDGTIGKAKEDLEKTAHILNKQLRKIKGHAFITINKALVTQASSAIPVVPLYISILYRVMKEKNLHEGCIEQIYRLFKKFIYTPEGVKLDSHQRVRIDDYEMRSDVQEEVKKLWCKVDQNNLKSLTDIENYEKEFFHLFGFQFDEINYRADVDPAIKIPSIESEALKE